MTLFNNITLIGLGLIGSSIAQAAKKYNASEQVTAYDWDSNSLNKAVELGIIDKGSNNIADSVKNSDLVIICTPISTYESIIDQIAPIIDNNTILTDVGSVKQSIISIVESRLQNLCNFVPAHPIAGSEKSGLTAGNSDLFIDKEFIITPASASSSEAITKVSQFWQTLGSNVEIMPPSKHDEIYAKSSHIPHLAAFCYAKLIIKNYNSSLKDITSKLGDEFAAFVRLAFSNPKMWTDIFASNKEPIILNCEKYLLDSTYKIENNSDIIDIIERINNSVVTRSQFDKKAEFKTKLDQTNILTGILPLLISCQLIESVEGHPRVGGGFLGMTQVILDINETTKSTISDNIQIYNNTIKSFIDEITAFLNFIKASDTKRIFSYLNEINS